MGFSTQQQVQTPPREGEASVRGCHDVGHTLARSAGTAAIKP